MPIIIFAALAIVLAVYFGVFTHGHGNLEKENLELREQNRTLEERNESLDRQNQLMEKQYSLFAMKPVMTLLSEEQFTNLARVVTHAIIAISKQPN